MQNYSTSSIGLSVSPQNMQSLEPTSMASVGNSENERDVGEEEVLQRQVSEQEHEGRTLQDVLGGGGGADGDAAASEYRR